MMLADAYQIEVSAPCPGWAQDCAEAETLAAGAARRALLCGEAPNAAVVDITLTDDDEQRTLNRTWRGKDAPTNVLAFPLMSLGADLDVPVPAGAPLLLGDVVLAFETVRREAAEQDKTLADHLRHLVVHGVLHLLGYDHENAAEAAIMEAREIAILGELGVSNPYRDTM
jgi:probable rRNA maturation factor